MDARITKETHEVVENDFAFRKSEWCVDTDPHGILIDNVATVTPDFYHWFATRKAAAKWCEENGYVVVKNAHAPGTKPDTSLTLGERRREWLQAQGGIQPTILRLIDDAIIENTETPPLTPEQEKRV